MYFFVVACKVLHVAIQLRRELVSEKCKMRKAMCSSIVHIAVSLVVQLESIDKEEPM